MTISLFGPDGVGKSLYARSFEEEGYMLINGVDVASWPDQTWHEQLKAQGLDESKIDDGRHFIEKIERFYAMLGNLPVADVIIDSDPLHKTLMHDYARAAANGEDPEMRVRRRFDYLTDVAGLGEYASEHHQLLPYAVLDEQAQAAELQRRMNGRGKRTQWDPASIEGSVLALRASHLLGRLLTESGFVVKTVYN